MSRLLKDCVEFFGTDNLYEVLGVAKDAQKNDLKKGYHKKSLAHHPDRADPGDKKKATQKFQVVGQVHCLLSNEERRAEYDETGRVDDDEGSLDLDKDWDQYWRLLFPKITVDDIKAFSDQYKGSEEELSDLKSVYAEVEGDMAAILDRMLCCDFEDEPRFRQTLQELIDNEELPNFDAFSCETDKKKKARARKAKKEAKEAEEEAKRLRLGEDDSSLMALIAQRQASRAQQADGFFSHLEAKYGGQGNANGTKKKTKTKKR